MGLYQQKHHKLGLKGIVNTGQNEGRLPDLVTQDQTFELFGCKYTLLQEKGRVTESIQSSAACILSFKGWECPLSVNRPDGLRMKLCGAGLLHQWVMTVGCQAEEDCSPAIRSDGMCLIEFWTCLGPVTPSSLPSYCSPRMGMSVWCPLCYHVLEVHNLSRFISSQLERNLPQKVFYLKSHPFLIDMILEETLGFRFDFEIS